MNESRNHRSIDDDLTPAARLRELAAILARGIVRWRGRSLRAAPGRH